MAAPGKRSRVFISSATGDHLERYRRAAVDVCHRLHLLPVNMEQFLSQSPPPLETCYREVDGADVFVLIIGHRYGSRPPSHSLCYTELEYQRARARRLPIYVFIADQSAPWPPSEIDYDADSRLRLERFAAGLRRDHTVSTLGELAEFRENLLLTLQRSVVAESLAALPQRLVPRAPALHAVPPYVATQPFVGRAAELDILNDWARSHDPVLVIEAIGGLGKSALAWNWLNHHAAQRVDELAGKLWWSFYDGSASIVRFLHEAAAYLTGKSIHACAHVDETQLLDIVIAELRARPYVLVLDGFERLLTAYHKFDPTKLRDDEVEGGARGLIDPFARDLLRRLTACVPSKIIVASRLMPDALEGAAGWPLPGVRHHRLPGLAGREAVHLAKQLGVHGTDLAIETFFERLGNHPLLIGAVCGLVRDYRKEPGNFDLWRADPVGGGRIKLRELGLSERQTRVLAATFSGLCANSRQVLGCLAILPGGTSYATLQGVNPLRPDPAPTERWWPTGSLDEWIESQVSKRVLKPADRWLERDRLLAEHFAKQAAARSQWSESPEALRAYAALDQALDDLERRGLLMWDRSSNTYDLHPVIRAFTYDEIATNDRTRLSERVRDHFTALPPEDADTVTNVEDLQQSITIFRALVGSDRIEQAIRFFSLRLGHPLLWRLGANLTIIELLEPLSAIEEAVATQGWLQSAYNGCRRLDGAEHLGLMEISRAIAGPVRTWMLSAAMHNLVVTYLNGHKLAAADRMLQLVMNVVPPVPGGAAILAVQRAGLANAMGDFVLAEQLLDDARAAEVPRNHPGFGVEAELEALDAALNRGTLRERDIERLRHLDGRVLGQYRMRVEHLKCMFWLTQGRLGKALRAAEDYHRASISKGVGMANGLALMARVFACAGNTGNAAALVESASNDVDRLHPAIRPYGDLAIAMARTGDARAAEFATLAYRQAWADGPPYCCAVELTQAGELLRELNAPIPELPTVAPDSIEIPFEDALRALLPRRPDSGET